MKYKIGDRVIFKTNQYKQYSWKLNDFEEYTITNRAFSADMSSDYKPNVIYYEVQDKYGTKTSWFENDDFLTLKKYRKLKLQKIKNGIFTIL